MLKLSLNRYLVPLAVVAISLLLAAAVACKGGSSSSPAESPTPQQSPTQQGSPSSDLTPTPQRSPLPSITPPPANTGPNAIEVITAYLADEGIDGNKLDTNASVTCPLDIGAGTPITQSRLSVGQFCLTLEEVDSGKTVFNIELSTTGEQWEVRLEFEDSEWHVANVEKLAG